MRLKNSAIAAVLAVVAVLGVGLAVAVPALDAADEVYHWQRAVQVSRGQLLADRSDLPNGYGGWIDKAALDFATWANRNFEISQAFGLSEARQVAEALSRSEGSAAASFPSTASFTPLAYLPQAAGIALARGSGGGVFAQLIAGRVANLLLYLGLIAVAIRWAPCGQRLLLALALTAPTLHLAASLSGDPLNLALPILLFAWCLRLRLDPSAELSWSGRYGLMLMVVSLALLKPLYLLLAAIALLAPARHFGGERERVLFLGGAFLLGTLLSLAWNAAYPFIPGRYWGTGADPGTLVRRILDDPGSAAAYYMNSLLMQMPRMWLDAWGRFGGYPPPFMTNAPQALSWGGLATLLALALAESHPWRDLRASLLLVTLAAAFTGAIFFAFWASFSPPGAAVIQGVQGRYFLPAFLLAGWALVIAAPIGRTLVVLRSPLLALALGLQAAALIYGVAGFRFYWSN